MFGCGALSIVELSIKGGQVTQVIHSSSRRASVRMLRKEDDTGSKLYLKIRCCFVGLVPVLLRTKGEVFDAKMEQKEDLPTNEVKQSTSGEFLTNRQTIAIAGTMDHLITFYYSYLLVLTALKSFTTEGKLCEISHYALQNDAGCQVCKVTCGYGEGMTNNCGHNEAGRLVGSQCQACRPGEFVFHKRYSNNRYVSWCQKCTDCGALSKPYDKPCKPDSDAVCGKCLLG
eukprot:gene6915-7693_t